MQLTDEQLSYFEQVFDKVFGQDSWEINPYLSPAEKDINKPILPKTDRTTNRMGHPRNWPGPDTPLVQAVFYSVDGNWHTGVFNHVALAIEWLYRQNPQTNSVVP